jgi:hypothetical protein
MRKCDAEGVRDAQSSAVSMGQASDHSGISDGPETQFQPARPGSRPRQVVIILFFEGNLKAQRA